VVLAPRVMQALSAKWVTGGLSQTRMQLFEANPWGLPLRSCPWHAGAPISVRGRKVWSESRVTGRRLCGAGAHTSACWRPAASRARRGRAS